MSIENNLFWTSGPAKEKLEELQKAQSAFASKIFDEGSEFQKKQFALITDLVQNQVAFSSQILSGALNIINDNGIFTEKKAAKSK